MDPSPFETFLVKTASREGDHPFKEVVMLHASSLSSAFLGPDVRLSVHDQGAVEAQRHKWIASEQAGCDLGDGAIRGWVKSHWNGFLRARWLEHLQGRAFWIELDHGDFGLLQRAFRDSTLIDDILLRLKAGGENLDIITWALDAHQPLEEVLTILEALDINSRRIECQLAARLARAS
jgi:hypothetical protein